MLLPILLLILHFVGDFLLQTDWMALNKSKRFDALFVHCLVYAACFLPFYGYRFAALTFLLHFVVDFWTSRLTTRLWFISFIPRRLDLGFPVHRDHPLYARVLPSRHWFFVAIGADQLLHFLLLAVTLRVV